MLDRLDLQILDALQRDATLSMAELGAHVGLSSTPCWKRVKRMEDEGLIERVVTVSGAGVSRPGNYLIPVGTPLSFIL